MTSTIELITTLKDIHEFHYCDEPSLFSEAAERLEQFMGALNIALDALKYHVEQTRPIESTSSAIELTKGALGEDLTSTKETTRDSLSGLTKVPFGYLKDAPK